MGTRVIVAAVTEQSFPVVEAQVTSHMCAIPGKPQKDESFEHVEGSWHDPENCKVIFNAFLKHFQCTLAKA